MYIMKKLYRKLQKRCRRKTLPFSIKKMKMGKIQMQKETGSWLANFVEDRTEKHTTYIPLI